MYAAVRASPHQEAAFFASIPGKLVWRNYMSKSKQLPGSEDKSAEIILPEKLENSALVASPSSQEPGELIEVSGNNVTEINAENVTMTNASANKVVGQNVTVSQSGIATLRAGQVQLIESGLGLVQGQAVTLDHSTAGLIYAEKATLSESNSPVLVARQIESQSIRSVLLISGKVNGQVETSLDTPRALLFGAAAGLVFGLIYWVQKLFGSKK
jgi:hypothetical protein